MLIDTQVLVWYALAPENLTKKALAAIQRGDNHYSIASVWEAAIKSALGKLDLTINGRAATTEQFMRAAVHQLDLSAVPVEFADACGVQELPLYHRDPFDRLIAVQCVRRKLPVISADRIFEKYGVARVW